MALNRLYEVVHRPDQNISMAEADGQQLKFLLLFGLYPVRGFYFHVQGMKTVVGYYQVKVRDPAPHSHPYLFCGFLCVNGLVGYVVQTFFQLWVLHIKPAKAGPLNVILGPSATHNNVT